MDIILALVIILAVVCQMILYVTSKKVKNPYSWKLAILAGVINVGLNIAMYYIYDMGVKAPFSAFIPLFILLLIFSILVSIIIIDIKYHEIPNEYNLAIFILGVCFLIKNPILWKQGLIGLLACLVVYVLLFIITKGNIGFGDVKMATALGLTLGISNFLNFLLVSFLSGAIVSILLLLLKIKKKTDKIAFGPYIAFAYILIFTKVVTFLN